MGAPYIDIHTHLPVISDEIISIQSIFLQDMDEHQRFSPFTAGIHPWHADHFQLAQIKEMLENLRDQNHLIAIGESGLDKKSQASFIKQKEIFEIQFDFAKKNKLPVVIHCVRAWDEILHYIKNSELPFILHHYHANNQITDQLLRFNCFFSFGKSLLKENKLCKELLKKIPVDRLFFETDDSQADIRNIYGIAAGILLCPVEELKKQLYLNYIHLFKQQ
jgi:TatD DNase family protein